MKNIDGKTNKNIENNYMSPEEIDDICRDIFSDLKDIKQRLKNIESFIKNKK